MKRRIAVLTGFGSNQTTKLANNKKIPISFRRAAKTEYFKKFGPIDWNISYDSVSIGVEATYQWDPIYVITISRRKEDSYWVRGQAMGAWGSKERTTTKKYSDYIYNSKFIKFVDKWHPILFKN